MLLLCRIVEKLHRQAEKYQSNCNTFSSFDFLGCSWYCFPYVIQARPLKSVLLNCRMKSCSRSHGNTQPSMAGSWKRMPAFSETGPFILVWAIVRAICFLQCPSRRHKWGQYHYISGESVFTSAKEVSTLSPASPPPPGHMNACSPWVG